MIFDNFKIFFDKFDFFLTNYNFLRTLELFHNFWQKFLHFDKIKIIWQIWDFPTNFIFRKFLEILWRKNLGAKTSNASSRQMRWIYWLWRKYSRRSRVRQEVLYLQVQRGTPPHYVIHRKMHQRRRLDSRGKYAVHSVSENNFWDFFRSAQLAPLLEIWVKFAQFSTNNYTWDLSRKAELAEWV